MDAGLESHDCDRCGDRYLRKELYAVAPTPLDEADGDAPFEARLCSYCVSDLRRDVFSLGGSLDEADCRD